jgi:hypothetical protein
MKHLTPPEMVARKMVLDQIKELTATVASKPENEKFMIALHYAAFIGFVREQQDKEAEQVGIALYKELGVEIPAEL